MFVRGTICIRIFAPMIFTSLFLGSSTIPVALVTCKNICFVFVLAFQKVGLSIRMSTSLTFTTTLPGVGVK